MNRREAVLVQLLLAISLITSSLVLLPGAASEGHPAAFHEREGSAPTRATPLGNTLDSSGTPLEAVNPEFTLEYTFYDFFNVPFEDQWDMRTPIYLDRPIGADCFAPETCQNYAVYPYVNWAVWEGDNKDSFIYSSYRLNVVGMDHPAYSIDQPVIFPLLGDTGIPGGTVSINWTMDYINRARQYEIENETGLRLRGFMDGTVTELSGTMEMDYDTSRKVFGVEGDPQAWWEANTAPGEDWGQLEFDWADWLDDQGNNVYDIFNGFSWRYVIIYFDMKPEVVQNQDGTNTTLVDLQLITWGHETLLARWFYWGATSYREAMEALNEGRTPPEPLGWFGMEKAWFEDLRLEALVADNFDFTLSAVMSKHLAASALPGEMGAPSDGNDVGSWVWQPMLQDYVHSNITNKPLSELNAYQNLYYYKTTPGSIYYGSFYAYDYVPAVWQIPAGTTLTFHFPTEPVIFFDPNLSPKDSDPTTLVPFMDKTVLAVTSPKYIGTYIPLTNTLSIVGPVTVDSAGDPPLWGLPWVELGPLSSFYTPRDPIYINGNDNFTAANGVIGGNGTSGDPYIIAGWEINASPATGIEILNTDADFVVRDVYVHSGGSFRSGISFFNVSNGAVENATVSGNWFGIILDSSSNVTLAGNAISDNIQSGLNLRDSDDLIIIGNGFTSNGGTGAYLYQISDAMIVDNVASSNGRSGIETHYSTNVTMSRNTASLNGWVGLGAHVSTDVLVVDNTISSNRDAGIGLQDAPNATLMNNTFTSDGLFIVESLTPSDVSSYAITQDNLVNGKPLLYYKDCAGLSLDGISAGQLIVANCANVDISNLHVENTDVGIELLFVDGANITGSTLVNNLYGAWLMLSANATISGSNLSSNDAAGVVLFAFGNGEVSDNILWNNGNGTLFYITLNVTIRGNEISDNGVGVSLERSTSTLVYHNNFFDNAIQSMDKQGSENVWDGGYTKGGNYWSNYTGGDNCSGPGQDVCPDPDGLGDVPYLVGAGATDSYPLMEPYSALNTPPVASFILSPSLGRTTTTFTVDATSSNDAQEAVSRLEVRWDWEDDGVWDTPWSTTKTATHQYPSQGSYTIRLGVRDTAGLTGQATRQLLVDDDPPSTAATVVGTAGQSGWFTSTVSVTLSATDDLSGVSSIDYRLAGGSWLTYADPLILGEGEHALDFRARDVVGNEEAVKVTLIKVDGTPPVLGELSPTGTLTTSDVTISWSAADALSGIARFEVSLDSGPFQTVGKETSVVLSVPDGEHAVVVRAVDLAGNVAVAETRFRVDTNIFSPSGPYAGIPLYLLVGAISAAVVVLIWRLRQRREGRD